MMLLLPAYFSPRVSQMGAKRSAEQLDKTNAVKEEKLTAMTAPRSVKLGKNILGLIAVNVVPVVGNKLVNRTLGGRNRLRLDARRNLTDNVLLDKVLNIFSGGLAGQREFGLVGKVLNHKGRPRVTWEVERLAMVDKLDSVNVNKVDNTLELFGKGLEFLDKLFTGRSLVGVDKEVCDGDTLFGIRAKVFGRDFVKERDGVLLDKLAELVNIGMGDLARREDCITFVKVLIEDNSGKRGVLGDRRKVVGKVLAEEV